MKKVMMMAGVMATAAVLAAGGKRGTTRVAATGADGGETVAKGKAAKVAIEGKINIAESRAPGIGADATLLPSVTRKARFWGILEAVYATQLLWQDELTVNWYVLTKTPDKQLAKNETMVEKGYTASPYSFFNATTRYVNIPKGRHMASVVLDPSTYERYGKPVVVSVSIVNKSGDELAFVTEDQVGLPKKAGQRWWEAEFMNNEKNGIPNIVRRTGLLDRSKTPFWLVNTSDFESQGQ